MILDCLKQNWPYLSYWPDLTSSTGPPRRPRGRKRVRKLWVGSWSLCHKAIGSWSIRHGTCKPQSPLQIFCWRCWAFGWVVMRFFGLQTPYPHCSWVGWDFRVLFFHGWILMEHIMLGCSWVTGACWSNPYKAPTKRVINQKARSRESRKTLIIVGKVFSILMWCDLT